MEVNTPTLELWLHLTSKTPSSPEQVNNTSATEFTIKENALQVHLALQAAQERTVDLMDAEDLAELALQEEPVLPPELAKLAKETVTEKPAVRMDAEEPAELALQEALAVLPEPAFLLEEEEVEEIKPLGSIFTTQREKLTESSMYLGILPLHKLHQITHPSALGDTIQTEDREEKTLLLTLEMPEATLPASLELGQTRRKIGIAPTMLPKTMQL